MDVGEWLVRHEKDFDLNDVYGKNPTFFTIELHHGGEFSNFPDITYDLGKTDFIDMVDSDRISVIEVHHMVEKLGYDKEDVMRYHFRIPGDELEFGLRPLANDRDVSNMLKYVEKHKVIEVYVEHKVNDKNTCMDDNEDSDFIVDEDNMIIDVNVDMDEFRAAVDCEDENITVDDDNRNNMGDFELDDFESGSDSDDEPPLHRALKDIRKQKKKDGQSGDCPFYLGQAFVTRDDIRSMVKKHAIQTRRQLYISRNDKCRFRVVCLGKNPNVVTCETNEVGTKHSVGVGPYPGQILTAIGVDANNGIYPVAYAVVESESASSWVWFLKCLGDDLDLYSNSNFTFISDRQKGIIPAISKVFPSSEHRYCLRHIHENMKQKWKGQLYKELLWKCVSATTTQGFDKAMKEVLKQDKAAYDWLKQIPPRHWSRAYFSGRSKCDVLLNNLCEVFNKQLGGVRDKPIITCLEFIREYIMKIIVMVRKMIAKCHGPLTPAVTKIFEKIKSDASNYTVIWNGVSKYQVSGSEHDQCAVLIDRRSCTCRKWELTGIPCKHAVACIWNMAMNGIGDGIPEKWVDEIYWLERWKKIYENTVDPINGKNLWIPSQRPTILTHPKHHTQVGRPSKKRKKSIEEQSQLRQSVATSGKMPRKGNTITCDNCKRTGHNKRTCKMQGQETQVGSQLGSAAGSQLGSAAGSQIGSHH